MAITEEEERQMRLEYERLADDYDQLYDLQKETDKRVAALKAMLEETKQQLAQARSDLAGIKRLFEEEREGRLQYQKQCANILSVVNQTAKERDQARALLERWNGLTKQKALHWPDGTFELTEDTRAFLAQHKE